MIWFGIFLTGLVLISVGLVKALRSRKPDMLMVNGGVVAAIGFMGYSRWPEGILALGPDQRTAGLLLMWWGGWLAVAWAAYQLLWSLRAMTWPKVQGTITHSDAQFMGLDNSSITSHRGTTKHSWHVVYSYVINGQTYTSSIKALDTDDQDSGLSSVTAMVAKHPVGSAITVYHHPKDHHLVCLDRSWFNGRWYVPLGFAAVLLWIAWPG